MGDKTAARRAAVECGVSVVPGSNQAIPSSDDAKEWAAIHGYPVILKAAMGGGGRGMRVVRNRECTCRGADEGVRRSHNLGLMLIQGMSHFHGGICSFVCKTCSEADQKQMSSDEATTRATVKRNKCQVLAMTQGMVLWVEAFGVVIKQSKESQVPYQWYITPPHPQQTMKTRRLVPHPSLFHPAGTSPREREEYILFS